MIMFEARDEEDILRLSITSVASLGPFLVEAAYLIDRGRLESSVTPPSAEGIAERVAALDGRDGPISMPSRTWAWAYPLRTREGLRGYLVLGSEVKPSEDARFLVKVLVQQTAVAMANASLYHNAVAATAEMQSLSDERAHVNDDLSRTVSELARQTRIQDVIAQVSASGQGEEGIASALHQLITLPVALEDRDHAARCGQGGGAAGPLRKPPRRGNPAGIRAVRRDRDRRS